MKVYSLICTATGISNTYGTNVETTQLGVFQTKESALKQLRWMIRYYKDARYFINYNQEEDMDENGNERIWQQMDRDEENGWRERVDLIITEIRLRK